MPETLAHTGQLPFVQYGGRAGGYRRPMSENPNLPSIYPTLSYDDARAAITFLTEACGFHADSVHEGEGGAIDHALLSFGNGAVMVSSRRDDSPFVSTRVVTYIALEDPDAHHDRAVAAGAKLVYPLTDQPYGSREYGVADPEGNVWCFGTYHPAPGAGE
jgi:uncharacterized glyoxalase superfamily protein PhnB